MKRLTILAATALAALAGGTAQAAAPSPELLAHAMATRLSAACPSATPNDLDAFNRCAGALRHLTGIPFADTLVWGGDQPEALIKKKKLTNFHSEVFQELYLPLFSFTGKYRVGHDARDDVDFIAVEAYFRNDLPPGEYPYPFWHSADKWTDYEAANELKFYLDPDGHIFVGTRSRAGSEAARGAYAHKVPPVFDGNWQWVDANGQLQPKVSLFANIYSPGNPYLKKLDKAYTDFALQLRQGTCLRCHAPNNRSGMDKLVILQTPVHAASEINEVLKVVGNGDMPQNDWGAKAHIDPQIRTALLTYGRGFRQAITDANAWETHQKHK